MILKPIMETLPATGATATLFSLGSGVRATDFAVQAQGDVDIHISDVEAMTTYWTIKSGTAQSISQVLGPGANIFYAKSSGLADVIEILPLTK